MKYPDNEFPWTFYFNGEAMSKWGQCWMSCGLEERARAEVESWEERTTGRDLGHLWCRIDHVGNVESEDESRLRIYVRLLLKVLLTQQRELEAEADTWAARYGATGNEVIRGIRDTLMVMSSLTERDGLAMWTTGYEADREHLLDTMRRVRLPKDSPEWIELPHLRENRWEARLRLESLRKDLVNLVSEGGMSKEIRQTVHQMRIDSAE